MSASILRLHRAKGDDHDAENEFLDPVRSLVQTPPSPVRVQMIWVICALLGLAIIASIVGHVDVFAVARGRVQPIGRSKVVQPLDTGKVTRILVRNGDEVHAGQTLLLLDPSDSTAQVNQLAAERASLDGEAVRRRAEIAAVDAAGAVTDPPPLTFPLSVTPEVAAREQAILTADLADLRAQLALLAEKRAESQAAVASTGATTVAHRAMIATIAERVAMRKALQAKGFASRSQLIDALEDQQREAKNLTSEEGEHAQALAAVSTSHAQLLAAVADFVSKNTQALADVENKVAVNAQQLSRARFAQAQTRIVSPIDGTVQQLDVTTIGQVVGAGDQVMTIVPRGTSVEVTALVENQDVGFVRAGQEAVVKVDSFPFTRYGTLGAHVSRIYRDAIDRQAAQSGQSTQARPTTPQAAGSDPQAKGSDLVFPVSLTFDTTALDVDGVRRSVSPGMDVTVEIRTGRRRVIEYLLSPLIQNFDEAGHEQ